MTLKYQVVSLDGLSEAIAALYTKGEDGKYTLSVEGAVPKSKLDEFRDKNVQLLKDAEKYKNIDPTKYEDLKKKAKEFEEKQWIEAGEFDKVVDNRVSQMKTDYDTKYNDLSSKYDLSQRQLESLLIDNKVQSVSAKIGIQPTALDDVLLRAKSTFKIKDGAAVASDKDGNIIYGKDGTTPMGIDDWAVNLKTNAPHLFLNSQGGGAQGSNGSGKPDFSNMSPTDKITYALKNKA